MTEVITESPVPEKAIDRRSFTPYSPCLCGSGQKARFCCLKFLKDEKLKRQKAKYLIQER